ncbi:uncharacterized protein LOC107849305 [Capsicum annuum]|uniref:uncharacterized protein LOC107849305 n=1 Tax=Capsicum annuum TaxID=4072 RepID=UPI001FB1166F|nr:uncharacterized protein LOC107849305 [Capsicum annuum]
MDLLAKHFLSGKAEKFKAVESQCTVATNADEEANYMSNQGVEALEQMSGYAKFMKDFVTKKWKVIHEPKDNLLYCGAISSRNRIMAPKGKSPYLTKKEQQKSVRQKLIDNESDYEEEEPLLRKRKKQQSPTKPLPPPLVKVEDSEDTEITIASEQETSEHSEHKQHDSEHAESKKEKQEGSEESESEGTASGSPSTEQQDDEEYPSHGTLIKCKNPEV